MASVWSYADEKIDVNAFEMVSETRLAAQAATDLARGLTRLFG